MPIILHLLVLQVKVRPALDCKAEIRDGNTIAIHPFSLAIRPNPIYIHSLELG